MKIEEIYNKYKPRMIGRLRSKGIMQKDAEDLVQEAFVSAYTATQDATKFLIYWQRNLNWQLKISAKKWGKEHKKYNGDKLSLVDYDEELDLIEHPKKDFIEEKIDKPYGAADKQLKRKYLRNNGENSLEKEEIEGKFLDFLETLPETLGSVLYEKYINNLTAKQIAEKLNLSLATVNVYCSKGLKKLKEIKNEKSN